MTEDLELGSFGALVGGGRANQCTHIYPSGHRCGRYRKSWSRYCGMHASMHD